MEEEKRERIARVARRVIQLLAVVGGMWLTIAYTPRLVFTGGPCCGQSASALMANLAEELGVPTAAILLEEKSRRTAENATYSAAVLRVNQMRSALLITGPLHLRRARLAFEHGGVAVLFHAAILEYPGLMFYRIQGWA